MRQPRDIVRRGLAVLLLAIYAIATISSSVAILTCEHPHHHHDHHDYECQCDGFSLVAECCDHHHPLYGENHTDYITSELRHESRSLYYVTMVLSAHIAASNIDSVAEPLFSTHHTHYIDDYEPLRRALIAHRTLRAPPVRA